VIAATSVLVSHAYPITQGPSAVEPLKNWIGISLGYVAVDVFFVVSGLLVAQSWERSGGVVKYTTARTLRIFPALVVMLLLTVTVLGPAVTVLPIWIYVSAPKTWSYLPHNLSLLKMQYSLPGVFFDQPFGPSVNGALWTLFHEVGCYVVLAGLGCIGAFRRPRTFAVGAAVWIVLCFVIRSAGVIPDESRVIQVLSLSPYFAIGVEIGRAHV